VGHGPTVMNARTVLRMATIGGAEVLGMEREIGSIETGKLADLILLDLEDYHVYPSFDVDWFSRVVYAATRGDVEMVMIDGHVVMEGRQVLTLDKPRVLDGANRALQKLLRRL